MRSLFLIATLQRQNGDLVQVGGGNTVASIKKESTCDVIRKESSLYSINCSLRQVLEACYTNNSHDTKLRSREEQSRH